MSTSYWAEAAFGFGGVVKEEDLLTKSDTPEPVLAAWATAEDGNDPTDALDAWLLKNGLDLLSGSFEEIDGWNDSVITWIITATATHASAEYGSSTGLTEPTESDRLQLEMARDALGLTAKNAPIEWELRVAAG